MNYTSIEQSKKLVELGLNPRTADMCYIEDPNGQVYVMAYSPVETAIVKGIEHNEGEIYPCWSIWALLKIMPEKIIKDKKQTSWLEITKYSDCYQLKYDIIGEPFDEIPHAKGTTLIKAAYNMIVWLLQNNYIKTE